MRGSRVMRVALAAFAMLMVVSSAEAQQSAAARRKAKAARNGVETPAIPAVDSVKLVFDREVFGYGGAERRDPFSPLAGRNATGEMGPRFQDLKLLGLIYVPNDPARSVATVQDANGKRYKVRRGDAVGNARVVEIASKRIVVIVENFGLERREVLELQRKDERDQEGRT